MTDETYRQSRKPINPEEIAPADVMNKISAMEKQVEAQGAPPSMQSMAEAGIQVEGNIPPAFQEAMRKAKQTPEQQPQKRSPTPPSMGPRLAYTNNPKLNELLEGIK